MSDLFEVRQGRFASTPEPDFRVAAVSGTESINELFEFQLLVTASHTTLRRSLKSSTLSVAAVERELLGRQVRFRVSDAPKGIDRFAMVAAVHEQGSFDSDGQQRLHLALTLVPRAWLLGQRRDTRIFQNLYSHEIVSQVLAQHGVRHRWDLRNSYARRNYCTQYEETDLAFVRRLLAEEGILFSFEHAFGFKGGRAPQGDKLRTAADTAAQTTRDIGHALGAAAGGAIGGAVSMLGDAVALFEQAPTDPDADERRSGHTGKAGPSSDGDVWVMVDCGGDGYGRCTSAAAPAQLLRLEHRREAGTQADPTQVLDLQRRRRLRPEKLERRDYDYRRPLFELTEQQNCADQDAVIGHGLLEVYEHHGEYDLPDIHANKVAAELEQHRADASTLSGRTVSARLVAGRRLALHDNVRGSDETVVLISVEHRFVAANSAAARWTGQRPYARLPAGLRRSLPDGVPPPPLRPFTAAPANATPGSHTTANTSYEAHFEAVAATLAHRPPRPRRRMRNVVETATVVGPVNDGTKSTVYTDKYGRVKVQFHWDRKGQYDQHSSCFLRVSQPWAGAGYGFQFIPRVGMEVLVSFIGGDPDRPVVTGTLYNQPHPLPEPLPERATRSVIRTQSVPEGDGFNEIAFEDARGAERIVVRAQRNLDQHANNNHMLSVGGNDITVVKQACRLNAGERVTAIERNDISLVGQHQSRNVGGHRTTRVVKNDSSQINGHQQCRVEGVSVREHRLDALESVTQNKVTVVGGSDIRHVGGSDGTSHALSYVEGHSVITASGNIVVRSDPALGEGGVVRLECGNSAIVISEDTITLRAKHIVIEGQQDTLVSGQRGRLYMDKGGALIEHRSITATATQGGHLRLATNATLHGAQVSLLSPQAAASSHQDKQQQTPKPNFELLITLDALDGTKRVCNSPFRLLADDCVVEGRTNTEGVLQATIPEDVKVVAVTVWPDQKNKLYQALYPPESGPLQWLVHMLDEAPEEVDEARMRLQNLGYRPSVELGKNPKQLDALTRDAVRAFQLDVLAEDGYRRADKLRAATAAHYAKLRANVKPPHNKPQKKPTLPHMQAPKYPDLHAEGQLDDKTKKLLSQAYNMQLEKTP